MSTPHPFLYQTFVDTSAFYALTGSRDKNHVSAMAIRDRLLGEKWRLFTTNIVVIETHALVLSRLGRGVALRVIQDIDRSNTRIVRVSPADERAARGHRAWSKRIALDCSVLAQTTLRVWYNRLWLSVRTHQDEYRTTTEDSRKIVQQLTTSERHG